MSQSRQKKSATRKLIEQHPLCCFCAGLRPSATREHMPPKSLFDGSHRPDMLVMPACKECNERTSTADLSAAIISRWSLTDNDIADADHGRLVRRMRKQAPGLVEEWTREKSLLARLKGRRHLRRSGVPVPDNGGIVTIGPLTVQQLNLFAHKTALALYFEHFRRPLAAGGAYCAFWKTKEDYARDGLPKDLLRMLPSPDHASGPTADGVSFGARGGDRLG